MTRMIFNPALVPVDQRAGQFVVRGRELETITTTLRRRHAPSNQHLLVIGTRGLGKSTLVHRVVAELHRDPELGAAWFPLVFPEEAYEVGDEGELWLEAVHRLVITTREPHWERQYESLRKERDTKRLSEQARQVLRAFAEQRGCRLLLVIENLDSLLGDQLSDRDAWALRKVLQDDPTFLLLATAVRRFPGVEQHDKAFYEAFRRMELQPLDPAEIATLWTSITRQPMPLRRAQAARVLTGGNPRLIQILAGFWRSASVRSLFDDLTGMVDLHTDSFRGNIEAISGQQRRVFLALAALWRPATAGDVARQARIESNPASVELGRLVASGRVEVVSQRGRVKRYQVAERLYNIYYLMRQGGGVDARVRALADFMVGYYDADAMRDALGVVWSSAQRGEVTAEDCSDFIAAMLDHGGASDDVRALVVQEAPAEYLAGVDRKVKRKVFRDPAAALLALQRADALEYAGDVAKALEKAGVSGDWDDVAVALAPFAAEDFEIAKAMVVRLVVLRPRHLMAVFQSGVLKGIGHRLACILGADAALREGDPVTIRAWRDATLAISPPSDRIRAVADMLSWWLDPASTEKVQLASNGDANRAEMSWVLLRRAIDSGATEAARRLIQSVTEADGDKPWVIAVRLAGAMIGRWEDEAAHHKLNELAHTSAPARLLAAVSAVAAGDNGAATTLARDASVPWSFRLWFAWKCGLPDAAKGAVADGAEWMGEEVWSLLVAVAPDRVAELWRSLHGPARIARAEAFAVAACTLQACRAEVLDAVELGLAQKDLPKLHVARAVAQAVAGRLDGALHELAALLQHPDAGDAGRATLIELCLALAASGVGREVADAIAKSPHKESFYPLWLAIDTTSPEDEGAAEELQVARDLREELRELGASQDRWVRFRQPPPVLMFPTPMLFVEGSGERKKRRR